MFFIHVRFVALPLLDFCRLRRLRRTESAIHLFSGGDAVPQGSSRRPRRWLQRIGVAAGITASIGMTAYAYKNWKAETSLILAAQAVDSRDDSALLMSADDVERAMEHVGTYHLEVARTIVTFLRENWNTLNEESRTRLAQRGIDSAIRALERTDKPMLALMDLITLAGIVIRGG